MPEAIRRAKEVHHAIHRRAHLGSATEKFDLLSGEFEERNDPSMSMLKKNNDDKTSVPEKRMASSQL